MSRPPFLASSVKACPTVKSAVAVPLAEATLVSRSVLAGAAAYQRQRLAGQDAGAGGDGSIGVEVALEKRILRFLGAGERAQRHGDVADLAGDDVEVGIDAESLDEIAAVVDELVGGIEGERTIAGVFLLVPLDHEKPVPFDREIGILAGGVDRAGGEIFLDRRDLRAETALTWISAAEAAIRCAAGGIGDVELRGEESPAGLERHRVGVGDVVADDLELGLVDVEARKARE